MSSFRLVSLVVVVLGSIVFLMWSAAQQSARAVVTVDQLAADNVERNRIRLGARVAEREISYHTSPKFLLRFWVHDPAQNNQVIPVEYSGIMPDTFRSGRDVILEGSYDGELFTATTLLTQCPSKYTPPVEGEY